jgi:iron complex outermembrane receptor protein
MKNKRDHSIAMSGADRTASLAQRLLLGAAAAAAWSTVGAAQTTTPASPAPAAAAAAANSGVQEVVVTSRYRRESANQVPMAISVFDGKAAAARNLNDIQDISAEIPEVDFRTGASNKDRTLFVRGLGTITTSPGVEPSVSTVIDGVVMARPGQATADILNLDRVEVLRGPQGTLFGKNASAGVINIVTSTPTDTFHAFAEGAYYEGDEFRVAAGVSGPIIEGKLDGQIAFVTAGYKGNVDNLYTGKDVDGYRHRGLRTKFVAKPTDNLTLTLSGDYTHSVDTVPTGVFASTNQVGYEVPFKANPTLASNLSASGITPSFTNRFISDNTNSAVYDNNGGVGLQADYKLGGFTVTSITAFRRWENKQVQDYDSLSLLTATTPQIADNGAVNFSQYSQELRLTSPKGGLIDYVVGGYFLRAVDNEVYSRNDLQVVGTSATGLLAADNTGTARYGTRGDNYAIYGEGNINFTSNFRAIIGFRGIRDDLNYYETRTSSSPVAVAGIQPSLALSTGSVEKDGYGDRFGLQYDLTRSINLYATYSRGYKGPAYNVFFNFLTPRDTIALNPETSNSYEVGIKGGAFEHRLQVNLSAFSEHFDNYQANFLDSVAGTLVTRLVNAGSVSSEGIEGDITARPIPPLNLGFSFASTDAHVDHFNCPANSPVSCNIDGKPLPFSPRFKMNLNGRYDLPLTSAFNLQLQSDYNWQSKVQYSLSETPDTIQPSYGIWNASLSLINAPQDWRVSLLVKNILDQHYAAGIAYGNIGGVEYLPARDNDRYMGISARKDF